MLNRRLQHAHADFGPIVGSQAFCHKAWQDDFGLPQFFNNARLHEFTDFGSGAQNYTHA